ncbi:tetratricopeptide repeat protein [Paraliomyxa miuraensis]|uniref:tetratricopeptide repeat protein n=1 Tax=Paraliomyxa miuraensis TaxID=376150 RepID=UPI00224D9BAC|nr:hypothetical protein [Paraliomyxa miuraensis]MCX4240945.1 hypothetical protein [Paraliomyxa miuraensis]
MRPGGWILVASLTACASTPAATPASTTPEAAPAEAPIELDLIERHDVEPINDEHATHRPSPEPMATQHREGCQRGEPAACHAEALDAYYAIPSPDNDRLAYSRFTMACDAGYAPSCNGLGVMIMQGRAGPVNTTRAMQLFVSACEAGASTACHHLADAARTGQGLAPNPALAERATARARCAFEASLGKTELATCPALGEVSIP